MIGPGLMCDEQVQIWLDAQKKNWVEMTKEGGQRAHIGAANLETYATHETEQLRQARATIKDFLLKHPQLAFTFDGIFERGTPNKIVQIYADPQNAAAYVLLEGNVKYLGPIEKLGLHLVAEDKKEKGKGQ